MLRSKILGATAVVALLVAPLVWASDSDTARAAGSGPRTVVAGKLPAGAVRPSGGTILGSVWNARNEGVPGALVRLRNIASGRIEATARANDVGRFTFEGVEGGSYVLELVNDDGRVIAMGHNFTVLPGETIATFIRLGAKPPWFAGFFANAGAAAVSSAASFGLTAVAPVGQPTSPQR